MECEEYNEIVINDKTIIVVNPDEKRNERLKYIKEKTNEKKAFNAAIPT